MKKVHIIIRAKPRILEDHEVHKMSLKEERISWAQGLGNVKGCIQDYTEYFMQRANW